MGDVIPIEKNIPHTVSEVVCLKCLTRFICARPSKVLLKDLQCGVCGNTGYIIETGESLDKTR